MASLIYPDLSWSGRFARFVRTLQVVAIAGTVGIVAGGLAVLAVVRPPASPPLHSAIPAANAPVAKAQPPAAATLAMTPPVASDAALAKSSPAPVTSDGKPVTPEGKPAVSGGKTFASRFDGGPQSKPLYDQAVPPPTAAAAAAVPLPTPSPLPKVHVPIQTRRLARQRKPTVIIAKPPEQTADIPAQLPPAAYDQPPPRRYYDDWRGPPAPAWRGGFFGRADDGGRYGGDDGARYGGGAPAGGFWGGGSWN